jgi:hypothetical protein
MECSNLPTSRGVPPRGKQGVREIFDCFVGLKQAPSPLREFGASPNRLRGDAAFSVSTR